MGKNSKNKKKPQINFQPKPTKEATHTKNPEGYQNQFISWHLQCIDSSGAWPCSFETLQKIRNRLSEYENLKWSEVSSKGSNHPLPINKIIPKAQRRLSELGYVDIESLYQLKISNGNQKQRLWGIRKENIFQILWWDPRHEVCPVEKRNT
ncbi:MAG: hypothetical protein KKD92_09180 [Proteobacteria bacterium]|nr:hypothetical protein [Pseudomonadota bacterium]